ncbi:MAG: RNA polymerase factor sigma-54 [Betaproteobacteria bacterium]|nr:RNA polymerase factor sigma-54 [Betaproteobacteria bacterium]
MKHSLQLKLSQHLTLTPQLQQSIRLLQLSTLELQQELEHFLEQNPLLERADSSWEEAPARADAPTDEPPLAREESVGEPQEEAPSLASDDFGEESWGDSLLSLSSREDADDQDYPQLAAETPTLRNHLLWQLNLTQLSERDNRLVRLLIDALNEDGYLTLDLGELLAMLPAELEIEAVELEIALKHLQHLDPPGIGARNLAECLTIQLDALPEDTPYRAQAAAIVRHHLDRLAARDYGKLKKALSCDDETLRRAQALIQKLNPRPGADFAPFETRYIVPDVIVRKVKGTWVASLNAEAMPKLRVNQVYADILARGRGSMSGPLAGQLQEAKWLIKNVQQRFDTILRVSQAIVDRQRHFLEHGEVAMRPLVLREIAEAMDLHESTVSRVTTQKFMRTPRGIYELKYFFGSHVTTEAGGTCSATAIRALIKQLVSAEDPKKPLSDSQISDILSNQGIVVARRTIAKYRESLQIPPVSLRKSI